MQLGCAGKRLAADSRYLRAGGAIDGYEHEPAQRAAVRAGVSHHILHIAGCRLQRGVAEICAGSVEIAKRAEASERVAIRRKRSIPLVREIP